MPPKQKPATPILKSFVGKGGGEERKAWKNLKTRGLVTAGRFLMKKGIATIMARMMRMGLTKMVVNHEAGLRSFSMICMAEASIALPVGSSVSLSLLVDRGCGLVLGDLTAHEIRHVD